MTHRGDPEDLQQGFQLRTAVTLAILLHLLAFLALETYELIALPIPTATPKQEPLRFVFAETPPSDEPPPETETVAAQQHRAQAPDSEPSAERQQRSRDVVARLAQPVPPQPQVTPELQPRPRPTPAATPQASPPPQTTPPAPLDKGRYIRRRPADEPPPVPRSFSTAAIAQAVQTTLPATRHERASVPRGVMDFDAKDYEWGPYAQRIYQIIEANWHRELRARVFPGIGGVSQLRFRIARNGRISGLELLKNSQWKVLDIAALGSIQLSDPLPQLPADYPHEDVGLTFSYYFNVDPPGAAE